MNQEIWQQLLSLESRELTTRLFKRVHSRELNARRSREIGAAARQAREYFRNANISDYTVRPLLVYYGVTSLSRSLLLLMKAEGGEEGLAPGHGLEAVSWGGVMSGDPVNGLTRLGDLTIRRTSGLFSDFVKYTNNRVNIHVHSGGIDWSICYDIPPANVEISLADLFSRIPDLRRDYAKVSDEILYAPTNEMTYSHEKGFRARVREDSFKGFQSAYERIGYTVAHQDDWCTVECDTELFGKEPPLFIHTYVEKMFGAIPHLYLAKPFSGDSRYSQLCITYMVSYVLGMLVRYYPTHWISLMQGGKGDSLWPTINRAQRFVEQSYPELVAEFIKGVESSDQERV